jgi:predicted RNA-binding Zn ribbon-like protein
MARNPAGYQFDFSGGALCLDFANTLGDRPRNAEEHLHDWRDLVAWGEQAGVVSAPQAAALRAAGARDPRASARALAGAIAFREALFRIFAAVAGGGQPSPADLDALNAHLAAALPHARIKTRDGRFNWDWAEGKPSLDRLLWPVARSAADVLVSPEAVSLRECASQVCSWLFLDRSPTQRRRWCSMKTCGNRAKARAFYSRQKELAQ